MQVLMNRPVTFTKPASNLQTSIFPRTLREYLIFSIFSLESWQLEVFSWNRGLLCYARLLESTKKNGFDVQVKKRARVCFQH